MIFFKFVRRNKGGTWLKTKHRGWIPLETYIIYVGYSFDPIVLKEEKYAYKIINNKNNT